MKETNYSQARSTMIWATKFADLFQSNDRTMIHINKHELSLITWIMLNKSNVYDISISQ